MTSDTLRISNAVNAKSCEFSSTCSGEKKVFWSQWLASLILSLITLLGGLAHGWSSPYLAKLSFNDSVDGISKLTDEQLSWTATLINIGRIVGVLIGAGIQEAAGRKRSLCFSGLPMLIGWSCTALASTVQWLYVARFLCGFATGVVYTSLPHYLSEIADPAIRGSLVLWHGTAMATGHFVGNLLGPYLSMRYYAYICIACSILYLALFPMIPDSPHRYVAMGDLREAEKSLIWFRRSRDVKKELLEIQDYVGDAKFSLKASWVELMESRYLKSFLMIALINVFKYFAAFNVINTYMEIIVTNTKVSVSPSAIVTTSGFLSILASLLAVCLVDRFGKRVLLVSSSFAIAVCLACLALHFELLRLGHNSTALTWFPCVSLIAYKIFFSFGVNGIPTVLIGELFSPKLKAIASLYYSVATGVFTALSTGTYVPLLNFFGEIYLFAFYAAGTFVSVVYYYFYLPETKGKSLRDIQSRPER